MQLDATRPWTSGDRPLLWREAGRRRRWSCRCCSSTRRDHGRRGIDRCSAAKRADGDDGAAGDAARRDAAMGVLGSTAALVRGGQAAAMELPVMQLDATRPWASRIDRRSAARRAGGGDGAAGDAARRDAAMGAVESTAALLRGERATTMELPVMQLDTSRPWASRIDPCSGARRAGGGDGAAGDAARRDAAMGAAGSTAALLRGERAAAMARPVMQLDAARPWASWDRPLLCCEASRRRRGSCR